MNTHYLRKIAINLLLGSTLSVTLHPVMALTISQAPLTLGSAGALPNIMLMVDNSLSMSASVPVTTIASPSAMPTSFTYSCPNNKTTSGGLASASPAPAAIDMTVTSSPGDPRFCNNSSCDNTTKFGNGDNRKCFDNTKYYTIRNKTNSAVLGTFLGLNLNWYFSTGTFNTGSLTASSTSSTRVVVAKTAAKNMVDTFTPRSGENPSIRLGLTTYNSAKDTAYEQGGVLLVPIADLTSDVSATGQATKIKTAINALTLEGSTPLAETLVDIGRYFTTGYTGNLTLHPNASTPTTASIDQIFGTSTTNSPADLTNNNNGLCDMTPTHTGSVCVPNPAFTAPITRYCQKNAVILVTDGLPNRDREVSRHLRNYSGDCPSTVVAGSTCDATPTSETSGAMPTTALIAGSSSCSSKHNLACKNGTKVGYSYEQYGSDYLDDVAQALYEMDLRPDLANKNNLKTYTIGVADLGVKEGLVKHAAQVSDGLFAYAANYQELASALDTIVADITKGVGSFSSIVANSSRLGANSAIFQAKYDSNDWTGDLLALPLNSTTGAVLVPAWNAGEEIPAWGSRNIYTYNANTGATPKGLAFTRANCSSFTTAQKAALGIGTCTSAATNTTDKGLWLLDYLRGDTSHEVVDILHSAAYTDPRASNSTPVANKIFRNRARFYNKDVTNATGTHIAGTLMQDPWLLGDIVNSDAAYASNENYRYATLTGMSSAEQSSYSAFLTAKNAWRKMIYIGANDGMLHGFDARIPATGTTDPEAGKEILAYIPNSIFSGLNGLSSPNYIHQYFVDGSPKVSDAYWGTGVSGAWHSVLVGTTGAGGRGVFALDVSDPGTFAASDVLWEISDTIAPTSTQLTDTANNLSGNMGYTLPQASIGKMHNGKWVTIVSNGYLSTNNRAVLFVIDLETGSVIKTFDTGVGSATSPNGLSTPIAVDIPGSAGVADGVIDAIYAGDLLGNMWKFDVSDNNVNNWKIAYGTTAAPAPLFTACTDNTNCSTTRQPITSKPQVGGVKAPQTGGAMVYFGTGKYFEDADNSTNNPQIQSFYGIWDKCPLVRSVASAASHSCPATSTVATATPSVLKTDLVQQSITSEVTVASGDVVRTTTANSVNYPTSKGWYINLLNVNVTASTPANNGERVVSVALLRGGRIIFVTFIPVPVVSSADPCASSSSGTGWLFELDAVTGSQPSTPVLDITRNGTIGSEDVVPSGGSTVPPSGKKLENGSTGEPALMDTPNQTLKFMQDMATDIKVERNPLGGNSPTGAARQSWRQL